jgi:hypothetical protein
LQAKFTKQSVSPYKYHINNNLVVNLAEPVRKTNEAKAKMNQTTYNTGPQKATFFPSNATATTESSSGNYSQNPERVTESGLR